MMAAGRTVDLLGLVRAAQAEIALTIITKLDSIDNARLAGLCQAARALHEIEMDALRTLAKAEFMKAVVAQAAEDEQQAAHVKKHGHPLSPGFWDD